jgi:hypothetical protein
LAERDASPTEEAKRGRFAYFGYGLLAASGLRIALIVMRLIFYIFLAISTAEGRMGAAQDVKPQGRVCISLVDPGPPVKEVPFRTTSAPGPNAKVNIYLDASTKCCTLIVALSKEGKLANGWRPEFSEVPDDFEEIELPRAPVTWQWKMHAEPLDIYVLFMSSGSTDAEEAQKVVSAMQSPKVDENLLAMQTNKLRELIGRITSENQKSNQTLFRDPEVGGVFRGHEFPWRMFAQSVNFGDNQPGVLILSSEGPGKADPVTQ